MIPILLTTLLACGDKDDDTGGEPHGAEACETAGTGEAVTATTDEASAPEVHPDEGLLVSLPSGEVSYLSLHVDTAGDFLLAAGTANVVADLWRDGAALGIGDGAPLDDCADDVPEHWDVALEAGVYTIELGPAAVDSVWLMFVPESGEHDHDH